MLAIKLNCWAQERSLVRKSMRSSLVSSGLFGQSVDAKVSSICSKSSMRLRTWVWLMPIFARSRIIVFYWLCDDGYRTSLRIFKSPRRAAALAMMAASKR